VPGVILDPGTFASWKKETRSMTTASQFKHPPTPPAIPNDAVLTGGTATSEELPYIWVDIPVKARKPFDPHSMSIGAVSVAALLEDAA
jgi:hypothetical protein